MRLQITDKQTNNEAFIKNEEYFEISNYQDKTQANSDENIDIHEDIQTMSKENIETDGVSKHSHISIL